MLAQSTAAGSRDPDPHSPDEGDEEVIVAHPAASSMAKAISSKSKWTFLPDYPEGPCAQLVYRHRYIYTHTYICIYIYTLTLHLLWRPM